MVKRGLTPFLMHGGDGPAAGVGGVVVGFGFDDLGETGDGDVGDVALRDAVAEALEAGARNMVVDLSGVSTIDSSGIGELVSAYTTVKNRGGQLKLCTLPPKVTDILQITQLISVFEVHDTEDEAVASF